MRADVVCDVTVAFEKHNYLDTVAGYRTTTTRRARPTWLIEVVLVFTLQQMNLEYMMRGNPPRSASTFD